MKRFVTWERVLLACFCLMAPLGFLGAADSQEELTLENVPPVVVKTVPEAGGDQVDPGTKSIKVTFSKEMTDGSWSWSTASKDSVPTLDGKPHYEADGKTCAVDVKLEPGRTYAIWLNSGKFKNFKDKDGRPSVPYLLVFRTAEKIEN